MAAGSNAPGGQHTSNAQPAPSLDGRTSLGKYEIVRQLGAGGMGTVYLAIDSLLKRTIALKVLPKERTENETLVRRFEAEAQSAAQLKHENIVTIYDAGRIDGYLYIALEFVEGTDIYELVARRGPLPLKRSVNFIKQLVHALEHLHQRGFVHRDIKPSNILVTKEGTVKLTDMGLARAVDESLKSNITREGTTVGTVDYMAPEQARDSQSADIRSDIYSLGCTWYQMLTGEPPYPTGSVTNKLYSHISKPRPDPRALNRSVPEEVVALLHRMMARKPDDRHQTPAELLKDIESLGAGNKRIEELLSAETDDAPAAATPAFGTPLALPPRHLPNRSSELPGNAARAPSEPPPRPDRMPARRGPTPSVAGSAPQASPSQRMPGRQSKSESDPTPAARRLPGRQAPDAPKDPVARPAIRAGRAKSVAEGPVATVRTAAKERVEVAGASSEKARTSNERPGMSNEPAGVSAIDWKPFAMKAAAVVGGILALGACVWLGLSWRSSAASRDENGRKSPFSAVAADLPTEAEKEDAAKKSQADAPKADGEREKPGKNQGLLVNLKKSANDAKPPDLSTVVGRPEERKNFPSWIAELWNPNAPANSPGAFAGLKTIRVGRVGNERADSPSLLAAIEELPEQGGIIELRGGGPFLLPPIKIANRRRLIITGISAKSSLSRAANAANAKSAADDENSPLIVFVPGPGAADSGLLAIETSLTLYGVQLAAFADQFPGDKPLRLIDVRSGDLTVQKCGLTLVGGRSSSTIAFSVSAPRASSGSDRPSRILLDRTFVRGNDLTALDADLPRVDLLAINSLFVTGKAPVLNLSAGMGVAAQPAAETSVPRNLRFFSCTTCTDNDAVALRLGASIANPPATRFHVMNSVFGAVFQPQGATMIALNDWPSRPITATNHVAFENLTWVTEAFIARGWQNLVQSDTSPPLGTKHAGEWAAYWGEPRSSVEYASASFPGVPEIAASQPEQFKWDEAAGRASAAGDSSPAGCDVGLLVVASPEAVGRADAFSSRPKVPVPFAGPVADDSAVREINLDNPKRRDLENLAKYINHSDWKSGTRFLVRGTNKKSCGPIHVSNRSLSIEFLDPTPPLLTFEDSRGDAREHSAFITVTGGTIEIVHANFRVGSTAKRLPHWLLDVKEGNFAIRDSSLEGPSFEKPGYEGLIHFSSAHAAGAPGKAEQAFCGEIRNSFLRTAKSALSGDLLSRNLIVENSVLAANRRVFDLRIPTASPVRPALDLEACTLAAGEEYFHVEAGFGSDAGKKPTRRMRVFAENTVFAPPLQANGKSEDKPVLFGGLPPTLIAEAVDWWEYACAYSNLIGLPSLERSGGISRDPLAEWKQVAGRAHIVRSVGNANAVLLPRNLPPAKDLAQGDFRLKTEAEAATWSDVGTPIGAVLAAQPAAPPVSTPAPKSKPTGGRKAAPAKTVPSPTSGF